jgi:purine-binding chemotaxis protein CheW
MKETAVPRTRFVVFQLGPEKCALPVSDVREIVALPAIARLPGLPPLIAGFMNLEGTAIPVVRLDHLFSLPEHDPDVYTPLIVMKVGSPAVALLVDRITDVVTVPRDVILPVQVAHTFNDCVIGEFSVSGETVGLLSAARLLIEKERRSIAEFQAVEQRRLRELEGASG